MNTNERPDDAAILAACTALLESPVFARSERLRAFLSYIVERETEGNGHQLKGYTIGVDVFGRPPTFNSDSDPLVRVHAGKLRKLIDQHYAGPGAHDPWRISVPKGSYLPVYERNVQSLETSSAAAVAERSSVAVDAPVVSGRRRPKWRPPPLSSPRALFSVLPLLLFMPLTSPAMSVNLSGDIRLSAMSRQVQLPRIAIRIDGNSEAARHFADAVLAAASHYRTIVSVAKEPRRPPLAPSDLDYLIEISAQANAEGLALRLIDTVSGVTVRDFTINGDDLDDEADVLFQSLSFADRTLSAHGAVFRHALDEDKASPLMRCIVLTDVYRAQQTRESFSQAKACQKALPGTTAFTVDNGILTARGRPY